MKFLNKISLWVSPSQFLIQKGFTLIELLIVIAILGILAATIMVAINPAAKIAASKNARVKSDLSSIGSQAVLFNTDTGIAGTGSFPNAWGASLSGITFMTATAPKDPSGNAYLIRSSTMTTGVTACDYTATPPTYCVAFVVYAPAYVGSDGVAAGEQWCWKSMSGSITKVAAAANCTIP